MLAAIDVLGRAGRIQLVSVFLLYHPSTEVVTTLLKLFTEAGRTDFIPIADRLQGNANPTRAMARLARPVFLPAMILALADRRLRQEARSGMASFGAPGLQALDDALCNGHHSAAVMWELPDTVAAIPGAVATPVLVRHLGEGSGMVDYRVVRALGPVFRREPSLVTTEVAERLAEATRTTLATAAGFLEQRLVLREAAQADPRRATRAHGYLVRLLRDKERHALDRAVWLVGLQRPHEDLGREGRDPHADEHLAAHQDLGLIGLPVPRLRPAGMPRALPGGRTPSLRRRSRAHARCS